MPGKARIDAPGGIAPCHLPWYRTQQEGNRGRTRRPHHLIAWGINRQRIFRYDPDKKNFLDRLSALLKNSEIKCYAWAVRDNHFRLLHRTGAVYAHFK